MLGFLSRLWQLYWTGAVGVCVDGGPCTIPSCNPEGPGAIEGTVGITWLQEGDGRKRKRMGSNEEDGKGTVTTFSLVMLLTRGYNNSTFLSFSLLFFCFFWLHLLRSRAELKHAWIRSFRLGFVAKGIGDNNHYDRRGVWAPVLWLGYYNYREGMDTMGSWKAIGRRKRVKVASLQSLFGEKEHIPLSWEEVEKKRNKSKRKFK
ncbi:hypothetical protein QBC34DRAFT_127787 [Podospora aff. communis PSN243]|uniref:Uncharacterized protein n=1 Tax=Podospora aff. communis PSN243 TaxID=3040156 RepID=A0AAV9GID4_9PEZI|nr:hypothetical protein QBC34DRAFT_127787 [Podospora aff. communis PSN243]